MPICIMSTGLPRLGLARSAHRRRMKLLRGYVSKSSDALNPLTITQLACELSMHEKLKGMSPYINKVLNIEKRHNYAS